MRRRDHSRTQPPLEAAGVPRRSAGLSSLGRLQRTLGNQGTGRLLLGAADDLAERQASRYARGASGEGERLPAVPVAPRGITPVDQKTQDRIAEARGGGVPLAAELRRSMEDALGV